MTDLNFTVKNGITIGNTSVNASINSTNYSATSNNSINLNGQPATYYTNASNHNSGTLPDAQLPNTSVTPGTYPAATVVVDSKGRITTASGSTLVNSFNTRTGSVTLTSGDVTGALTYTPVNKAGDTVTGAVTINGGSGARLTISGTGGEAVSIKDGGDLVIYNGGNGGSATLYCDTAGQLNLSGTLAASGDIIGFYSDDRLKTNKVTLADALKKVNALSGFTYNPNILAEELGFDKTSEKRVGVSAQEVQSVLAEAVKPAPANPEFLTVQYEKIVPLLIEAIKELTAKVEKLENR